MGLQSVPGVRRAARHTWRACRAITRRHLGAAVCAVVLGGLGLWSAGAWTRQGSAPPETVARALVGVPRIQGRVLVFTAASLTEAFKELGTSIEQANPGTKVVFNFAGSPTLRMQLAQGARADVFAAADEPTMQGAQHDGSIAGQPGIFARNQLVVIVPAANPAHITRLHDLARAGVKLVLTSREVPVGNYSRQALASMSQDAAFDPEFATRVLANVISEETNVKQVVARVQLGEADAGVVYASDVTPTVRRAVQVLSIPDHFNVVARYPIAAVQDAPNAAGASAFIDYVLSAAGQTVLTKHGFIAVAPPQRAN